MKKILLFIVFLFSFMALYSQCTNVPNGIWPSSSVSMPTTCIKSNITTAAYTGEYSTLTGGTNGSTYQFSSSVATDYITLTLSDGVTVLASGVQPLNYTFLADQTVNVIRHNSSACDYESISRTISVQCTSCSAPSSTTTQPLTTTVTAGTIDNQILRLDANVCGETITSINFATSGSTDPTTDISNAKVYYTTTTTFSTATQYGTTVPNPNGSFTVTGSQFIGSVGYFWLTYDLKCGAVSSNLVDGECSSFVASGSGTITPSPLNPTGTRSITASSTTITTNQPSTAIIAIPSNDNQVLRVQVTSCANSIVTQLDLATTGSTNPGTDITSAKVYFTTTTTFSTSTLFGSQASPNGAFTIAGSQVLTSGTGYFWLVYDIPGSATNNDVVDAECTSVTKDGSSFVPGTTNPAGTRILVTPPSNDDCSGATAFGTILTDGSCTNLNNQTTANATNSNVTPTGACSSNSGTPDDDVWFSFVAPGTTVILSATWVSGLTDIYWQVFSSACGSTMTSILCTDTDAGGTLTGLTIGATYYIRLYTYATTGSTVQNICLKTPPPPPANDDCAGATAFGTILTDGSCTYLNNQTTASATNSNVTPTGACSSNSGTPDDDVWFSFVAPSTSVILSATWVSGLTDIYWQVFSSACGSTMTSILCTDTDAGGTLTGLTIGATYYIRLYTYATTGSTVQNICLKTPPPPPANDDCVNATAFGTILTDGSCTYLNNQTTASATNSNVTPTGACSSNFGSPDDDVWFSFVAPSTSVILSSTWVSGETDVYWHVYSSACGSTMTSILCTDTDAGGTMTGLTIGATYYIRLYTYYSAVSTVQNICLKTPPPMSFVSCTVGAQTTTAVTAGTNDASIVRLNVVVLGLGTPLSATSFTCNTNGSTSPVTNNVTTGKIYYTGTSSTFTTTTLVGSVAIAADGSFTITGSQVLTGGASNTTNYFWLAYDTKCTAINSNLIDGEFNSITIGGTPYTPTAQSFTGSRTLSGFSVATNQPSTATLGAGATDGQVLRMDVVASATCGNLTQVVAATTGTTNVADLVRAKVYYTGTSTTFSNATQFGSTITNPSGTMTFDGNQTMLVGTNYFWLVYDINCSVTPANVVDAALTNVTYTSTLTPVTPNPTGTRALTALTSYDTKANGNFSDVNTWACAVPPSGGSVAININHNVTFDQDFTLNANLTIAAGKTLSWNSNTMTIGNSGTSASLIINGTLNISTGILNVGTVASVTTSNVSTGSSGSFNVSGGIVNVGPTGGFRRTFTNAGIFNISGGIFNMNGTIASSGNFSMSSGDLNIDANDGVTVQSATSFAITGATGTVSGGTITFVDPPFSGSLKSLTYSNSSDLTWTNNTVVLGSSSGSNSSTGTLGFSVDTWASTGRLYLNNLICDGGSGTNRYGSGPSSSADDLNVAGTFTVNSGSEFRHNGTGGTSLSGNVINNGTITLLNILRLAKSTSLAATTSQSISGNGVWRNLSSSPTANIASLTINNTSGLPISIPNSMISGTGTGSVSGTLTLTSGILDIGGGTFTLGTSGTSAGTLSGGSSSAYIIGTMKRWVNAATGVRLFPIGTASSYYGATINYTGAPTTAGSLTAQFITGDAGSTGLPLVDGTGSKPYANTLCTSGYWQIDAGNSLAGGTYTASMLATSFSCVTDYATTRLLKRITGGGNPWTLAGTFAAGTGSNGAPTVIRSGLTGFSQFAVSQGELNPLPVELTTFKGEARDKVNMLSWQTASEINSAKYLVERAPEADNALFLPIGEVNAKGNTTTSSDYAFMDEKPLAESYYRLKIMDNDGSFEYSKIIVLQNASSGTGHVNVYPVPAHNAITLAFQCNYSDDVKVVITDMNGRIVKEVSIAANKGQNTNEINIENLPMGMYHAHIYGADIESNVRIIRN